MSWIAQYKDPASGSWKEKEFDEEQDALFFVRRYELSEVYHS